MPFGARSSMPWYNDPNVSDLHSECMLFTSLSSNAGRLFETFDWWLCIFPFGRLLLTARRSASRAVMSWAQASGMSSLNLQIGLAGSRRRRLKSYHNDVMVVISVRGGSRSHSFRMSIRYPPYEARYGLQPSHPSMRRLQLTYQSDADLAGGCQRQPTS